MLNSVDNARTISALADAPWTISFGLEAPLLPRQHQRRWEPHAVLRAGDHLHLHLRVQLDDPLTHNFDFGYKANNVV